MSSENGETASHIVSVANWLRGIRKGITALQGMYTGSYVAKPIWRGVLNVMYINRRECVKTNIDCYGT